MCHTYIIYFMKAILITGGSSGIGLATAELLGTKGYRVYAGARRYGIADTPHSDDRLIRIGLDVNSTSSIASVIETIQKNGDTLYALISNAGNGMCGAVEDTHSEEVRYQMETNFFGAVKVIQACLPLFRKQGYGKIIAISSVAAFIPIPYQAFYSSAKAALLLFMDALSIEVRPHGIQCCTILPGDTQTDFTSSRKPTQRSLDSNSAYTTRCQKAISKMEKDEKNGMTAQFIAKSIARQIEKKSMSSRVVPSCQYKLIRLLSLMLPNSLKLKIIHSVYA